ncbi:hypothetical protein ARMSODRAFT_1027657 [Armillaria solidipes]|uniref:Uncharacterized protein n=1 Tax=Armillaria solidipes TaxID=1076256 RepID=A0A2H3AN91_9AGAR|nr:hypothetical protein ARMSODRAFT_1027657 [Armillaria solidipes]
MISSKPAIDSKLTSSPLIIDAVASCGGGVSAATLKRWTSDWNFGTPVFLRSGVGIFGPTFHERCDGKEFMKLVEEANNLVTSLPIEPSSGLSDVLHLAAKGIVTECSSADTQKSRRLMATTCIPDSSRIDL